MSKEDDHRPLLISITDNSVNSASKSSRYGSQIEFSDDKKSKKSNKNSEENEEEEREKKKKASKFGRLFRKIFTSQTHERKSTEDKEDEYETNSNGMREVFVGKPDKHDFRHGNGIRTSKYTLLTFLPLNTFEQFRRLANLYFLINSGIALIPSISPVNPITTVLPLAFVFGVTALKEGWEDIKRHRSDGKMNSYKTQLFNSSNGKFEETKWSKLKVGQVVKIENGQQIPADILLLSSSEEKGIAFVEASSLDGEAGLRRKEPLKETAEFNSEEKLKEWIQKDVLIECERPNDRMNSFEGRIKMSQENSEKDFLPLTMKQILLRGCSLQSTDWVYGVVVFTGHDTKTMRNAKPPKFKLSAFEHSINHFLILLLIFTVAIMTLSSTFSAIWSKQVGDLWYLPTFESPMITFLMAMPTFLILYNVVIPISLYVSMEMVKVVLTFFITHDIDMYDEETNTRAKPRTSGIIEELGQIGYIFADKTGTLTVNVMKLLSCSIDGAIYDFPEAEENQLENSEEKSEKKSKRNSDKKGKKSVDIGERKNILEYLQVEDTQSSDDEKTSESSKGKEKPRKNLENPKKKNEKKKEKKEGKEDDPVEDFMFLLAICNSVIPQPDPKDESKTIYCGSSPDESALVESAKRAGFTLEGRTLETATINGKEYQVLNNIEFTSERKKMSSIIKMDDGKIFLYSKGADSAILENLSGEGKKLKEKTEKHIQFFAEKGLRTLCMAKKEIEESEYQQWSDKYKEASSSLEDRDKKMEEVSAEIEKDLTLIGAVAIEDKLQKEVPESISILREAGLKVWVLTGDKLETAVNIAKCAKLIDDEEMNVVIVRKEDGDVLKQIEEADKNFTENDGEEGEEKEGKEKKENALVVDGAALTEIFKKNKDDFFNASKKCKSVLVCRASPLQKSEVVALYKDKQKKKLLAIGDGANDVSMIREAHVGVGISGKEGMQAAMSSDYAIAQFRFLVPLLLHHGRWAYKRLSKLVLYSFYKNITFCMCQFWFALYNNFSGQTLFDSWSLSMFNTLFTSLPILVVATFDQDVSKKSMKKYPQLYQDGIDKQCFSIKWASLWFIEGLIHSAVIFFGVVWIFNGMSLEHPAGVISTEGREDGLWAIGTAVYSVVIMTVTVKLALEVSLWNLWVLSSLVGSILLWFLWLVMLGLVPPSSLSSELYYVPMFLFHSPAFWYALALLPCLCLIPDFTYKYLRRRYYPFNFMIVQEIQRFGEDCEKRKDAKKNRGSERELLLPP